MNDEPDKLQANLHRVWPIHRHFDFDWNFSYDRIGTRNVNLFDDLEARLNDDI